MYSQVTKSVKVSVTPRFLEDHSDPEESYFFWAYTIEIENQSSETIQLCTRYWKITDAGGQVQEVRGEGVVGEQPVLRPGEVYQYTSGTPLQTSSGIMVGSYLMQTEEGGSFNVDVPAFSLDCPYEEREIH